MRKAVVVLILLGVVMGCGNPSSDVPSTTNNNSVTQQPSANVVAPETKQFQLKYKISLTAEPLTQINPVEKSKQLKSQGVEDSKFLIYKKNGDGEQIYAALKLKDGTYDIGQIGYGDDSEYSIIKVDVLGQSYVKVTGSIGANAPISYYVSLNASPPTVLLIEAHTIEADVDEDGNKEIVATVGTAAETSIYKIENDSLVSVNLNEAMNAAVVMYDQKSNTFKAEVVKGQVSQWKIGDNLIVSIS